LKNHTYSTIVFDLGNVLIPFDHSLWVKNFNNIENALGDDYYEKYKNNYEVHRNYERGMLTDDQFISINMGWLKNKVSEETFIEVFSNIFTLNQNVIDLLPILKAKYKLVLLSNTNNIHRKFGWQKYSFLRYFDNLILSHEVGAVKPEEKIYKAVEKFTGESAESHIFVDYILVVFFEI
jgi:putative hydrolase of the HAD superfamily